MDATIRVVIVDDHALVRQGIRRFLAEAEGIEVVAEAEDGFSALSLVAAHRPDVVVLDIRMPDLSGVEVTRRLKARQPDTKVLILTAYDDDPYIFALLQAGADGYVLKTARAEELISAVKTVYAGETALSPAVAAKVVRQIALGQPGESVEQPESLTAREIEVLRLAAQGMTNRQIGHTLGISHRTVQGHLANVYGKLAVNSRTEAVTEALKRGWIIIE